MLRNYLCIFDEYLVQGGFQANVAVKGLDFESSCGGNPCSCPRQARESAATQMLANLRNMAKSDHSKFLYNAHDICWFPTWNILVVTSMEVAARAVTEFEFA
ncbi:hypothetical protein VNO77_29130 [Canavalia gladiata]|uniref:Uncharacterized protein n=1 Tax=Canavalia gladiata TaxID=3824 RepID=A0AAN9Q7J0_CANGL